MFLEQIPELFDSRAFLCVHVFCMLEMGKGRNNFEFFKIVAGGFVDARDIKRSRMTKIFCKFAAVLNCTRK